MPDPLDPTTPDPRRAGRAGFEPSGFELGHIGRYELIAKIGAGGMGEVYLARSRGAGGFEKQVVIKRILPHLASDPGFVQRFIEEGKLVVKLRHAGIAQVLDMGEQDGVFFIAMEYVDGKDLGELVRLAKAVQAPLAVPLAVYILAELLEALDYAHRATDEGRPLGIIHRDISPSNLLVSQTGSVKLVDFGIARATERLQGTTTGVIRGKYGYMSPQQAAGADLDARSDLFSVGVVAWELLAGQRPFDGASDLLTLDRVRFLDPGPLTAVAPHVPEDLSAWVVKLLSKSPDDRFATADDALKALRAHMLRSGQMAGARELGDWVASLEAALPAGLRNAPTTGMSLDDVLRLGLGGVGGGPQTMDAAAPRTPSAPIAAPRYGPPGGGPVLVAPGLGAGGSPPAGPLLPSPARSEPRSEPGHVSGGAPGGAPVGLAGSSEVAPKRRIRSSLVAILVGLNLALIALVLFLVLRDEGTSGRSADATTGGVGSATVALVATTSPDVGLTAAGAAEDVVAATAEVADGADAAVDETTPEVGTVGDAVAPGMTSGQALGQALDELGPALLGEDVELSVRATPATASVVAVGLGPVGGGRKLVVRRGTVVRLRATAPDFQPASATVVAGEGDPVVSLTLKPVARGAVTFRFLPANAIVTIDGHAVAPGRSSILSLPLPIGAHTLVIAAGDKRLPREFEVRDGEVTNLGTLDATKL